jgi:hypothetical protein
MAMLVRRDSAVKLIDGLTGESPVSADCPVGTVVIAGDGGAKPSEARMSTSSMAGRKSGQLRQEGKQNNRS